MSHVVPIHDSGIAGIDAAMTIMEAAFDPEFGEAWNRGQCLGILSLSDTWLSLAGEPAPAGFALARRMLDDAELLLLAVAPSARGHGIARALIEHTAAESRRRGASRLLLEVRANNGAASLYEQAGFAAIGRRTGYYRSPNGTLHDALTLARSLG